ncbi:Serine/arginine-rich splicing factor SR45a [Cucurbita argyrosperma subsp. argyrosperma]|nr:Serine/arginine-rich splicing factor SR45a [Cucurbita argyrosperma subsp. argyrosperma]
MSYSRRSRYSRSPSYKRSVSRSLSRSRSRSRSPSSDVENPGNNLYVTGLSHRITRRELEKHFSAEGTVLDVHLVTDPWTRESRGFGFITMSSNDEAERCIKYLNRSVLEGRLITVEKRFEIFASVHLKFFWQQARRRRGRTPTPGRYFGLRTVRGADPILPIDAEDQMTRHTTAIDHTPLIAAEDMILHTIGVIGRILDRTLHVVGRLPGDVTGRILDPTLHVVGCLPGDTTGRTHLTTIAPLIHTTEGTGIGQFLGVSHQRQGFLVDVIPAVILLGTVEAPRGVTPVAEVIHAVFPLNEAGDSGAIHTVSLLNEGARGVALAAILQGTIREEDILVGVEAWLQGLLVLLDLLIYFLATTLMVMNVGIFNSLTIF